MNAAPDRRAVLGAVLAGAATLPAAATVAQPSVGPAAEDREVLALRAEFERLEAIRQPIVEQTNELSSTFSKMARESGHEAARVWSEKNIPWTLLDRQLEELDSRANVILERMVALRPRTLAGLAALAATMKEDALGSYWNKPDEDRDWDVMLITRFIDGLIEVGRGPGVAPLQGAGAA